MDKGKKHAAAASRTGQSGIDQFDTRILQSRNQLHERIDIAADHAVARLHALDGRQRQAGQFGELALVDAKQRPRRPQLCSSNHA